jgi:hypothetical protein
MPILILALIALAIFGFIGILLGTAAWCEFHKKSNQPAQSQYPSPSPGK